jgi:uncharacterized protein
MNYRMMLYLEKTKMRRVFLSLLLFFCFISHVEAIEFPARPNPPRLVNDFTNTLSPNEERSLEQKLVRFDDSTSIQIAVVMLNSIDGYPISDYAFQLGQKWGVGSAKENTGVLVLIALKDKKIFIATGYGLEGVLPDAMCRRIIENDFKPGFKTKNYFAGIDQGTNQLIALSKGEYKATPRKKGKNGFPAILIVLVFIVIIFFAKMFSVRRYSMLNSIPFWTAWQLLAAAQAAQSGKWNDFNRGSGGFSGWSGGGSSSGGSFGGFGGGSFGGGGAGGSW